MALKMVSPNIYHKDYDNSIWGHIKMMLTDRHEKICKLGPALQNGEIVAQQARPARAKAVGRHRHAHDPVGFGF